jgi:hypothetical protein
MDDRHPPTAPHWRPAERIRLVLLDRSTRCDACGDMMPPGTDIEATPGDPPRLVHDGRCPTRWTPTVIDGTGEPDGQPRLPFLAAVEETP